LVCRDREVWVFVEVKCRQERWGDGPGAAVSWWKRRRLIRLAQHYLKWMHITEAHCRFDLVAVTPRSAGRFEVRHIPAAFDATGVIYAHEIAAARPCTAARPSLFRVQSCSLGVHRVRA